MRIFWDQKLDFATCNAPLLSVQSNNCIGRGSLDAQIMWEGDKILIIFIAYHHSFCLDHLYDDIAAVSWNNTVTPLSDFSSSFIGVFIISTADHGFGLLFLISAVRKTKVLEKLTNRRYFKKQAVTMIRQSSKQLFLSLLDIKNGDSSL